MRNEEMRETSSYQCIPREKLGEAFEEIKKNAYIKTSQLDEAVRIYTTGIGGAQFGQKIQSELNVKYAQIVFT